MNEYHLLHLLITWTTHDEEEDLMQVYKDLELLQLVEFKDSDWWLTKTGRDIVVATMKKFIELGKD